MTHTKNVHNTGVTNTCWRIGQSSLKVPTSWPDILENTEALKSQIEGATNTSWRTRQSPLKAPTRDPHRSKHKLKSQLVDRAVPTQGTNQWSNRSIHKDNHFYGHSSRTQCDSPRQNMNFFPRNHDLIDSQSSHYHILIFQRSSKHPSHNQYTLCIHKAHSHN